jgi:hypothetical protein
MGYRSPMPHADINCQRNDVEGAGGDFLAGLPD